MRGIDAQVCLAAPFLLCALLLGGCNAGSGGSNATLVSVFITGPTTVTPGSPITLTGIGRLSDGTTDGNPSDLMGTFSETWTPSPNDGRVTVTNTSTSTQVTATVAANQGAGSVAITLVFTFNGVAYTSAPYTVTITIAGPAVVGGDGLPTRDEGASCTPSGSEAALSGHYAMLLHGFKGSGLGTPVALAASFTANGVNGNGLVTAGGEEDLNNSTAPQHLTITGGTYTIGSDLRGCVQFQYSGGTTTSAVFHFALGGVSAGVASKGDIIEFDDTSGTGAGSRTSGILRIQTTAAFAIDKLSANYTFGLDGMDFTNGHFAIAGLLGLNTTTGAVTSGSFDNDDAGTPSGNVPISNTSALATTSTTTSTGRTILTLTAAGATNHEATYIVNATELFEVQIDQFSSANPILSGRALATGSSFTAASIAGNQIIHLTGASGGNSNVNLGLLTFTSPNTVSGSFIDYTNGSGASTKTLSSATYAVGGSTGRVTLSNYGGNSPPIFYIAGTNNEGISAFVVGTGTVAGSDARAVFGLAESQAQPVTYSNSSVAGTYFFGSEDPGDNNVPNVIAAGVFTAGAGPLDRDYSLVAGLTTGSTQTFTFTILSTGLGTGSTQAGDSLDAVTNGSKVFSVNVTSGNDAGVRVLEK